MSTAPRRNSARQKRWLLAAVAVLSLVCAAGALQRPKQANKAADASPYANPQSCIRCHRNEAAGYDETGMAHAFSLPSAAITVDSPAKERVYFHRASSTWFTLTAHDGRFFERRWQKGFDGGEDNVEEQSIDYVMGSGNHARTFLHREPDGTLIELPMAWYAENGGEFAMNPGFDNAKPDTHRTIAYECMFCHNGYPEIPDPAHRDLSAKPIYDTLPMGIGCQRCHGPGEEHVRAAEAAKPDLVQVRATILNPDNLSNERQMQVCEQCHLETTSALLPDRVRHYDRAPFSYDPRRLLSDFNAYFTRDPAHTPPGQANDVEIVNAAFRLRQSRCFRATGGALTCERCHDPHDLHKGPQSAQYYANICLSCHGTQVRAMVAAKTHPDSDQCVRCHMPERRTSDVVHVVMTDHLIQRFAPPPAQALAPLQEATSRYFGPVLRYRIDGETLRPDDVLYDAVAQVIDGSNNAAAPALAKLLAERRPCEPNFYIELGDAERHNGRLDAAITAYREAVALDPKSSRGMRRLGVALGEAQQNGEAIDVFGRAIADHPGNELLLYERAQVEAKTGDTAAALSDLRRALDLRPDYADALNNLGTLLAQDGDPQQAKADFRKALAANPYDASAHANLGRLLSALGGVDEAGFQLDRAVKLDPANADMQLDDAVLLLNAGRTADADGRVQTALRLRPGSARGLDLAGQVDIAQGKTAEALAEFKVAAKADPRFGPAQLDVGETYIEAGDMRNALLWLQRAEHAGPPAVAERAAELLRQIGSSPK